MAEKREIRILMVEDTEEHALLVRDALEEGRLKHRLFVVETGEEALDFLYNRGNYADEGEYPKPDIILLDLRLPGMDGREVLKQIKREERLKDIPVNVLTVSKEEGDIVKAYQEGADSYTLKSVAFAPPAGRTTALLDAIVALTAK